MQIFVCAVPPSGSGKVCSGTLSAPAGADAVAITLEDQPQSGQTRGNILSAGSLVALVNAGTTNSISAVLDGVVHNVAVAFAAPQIKYAPTLPYSAASQGTQTVAAYAAVNAYDADGNVITANGGYVDASGNNVAIGLSASSLCGESASCSALLGAGSVAGPGSLVPVTVTLNDSRSQYSEPLTITPSIIFGNPGGTLTAGTVNFVRPSSCSAYLPPYSPTLASTLTSTGASAFDTAQTLSYSVGFGTPSAAQTLDPRIAVDLYLTLTYAPSGNFNGTHVIDIVRTQNGTISQLPKTTQIEAYFANPDQPQVSLSGGTSTLTWNNGNNDSGTATFPIWLTGNGNLCNDQVPLPTAFPATPIYV